MTPLETGLLFLCCSLVYVAPTMAVGATQGSLSGKRIIGLSSVFALAQTWITLMGALAARWAERLMSDGILDRLRPYFILVLLTILAAYMIFKVLYPEDFHESMQTAITPIRYVWLAIRWFFPILVAGAALALGAAIDIGGILLVFACSLGISITGLCYGYWQGYRYVKTAYAVGGSVLIVILCKYFASIA